MTGRSPSPESRPRLALPEVSLITSWYQSGPDEHRQLERERLASLETAPAVPEAKTEEPTPLPSLSRALREGVSHLDLYFPAHSDIEWFQDWLREERRSADPKASATPAPKIEEPHQFAANLTPREIEIIAENLRKQLTREYRGRLVGRRPRFAALATFYPDASNLDDKRRERTVLALRNTMLLARHLGCGHMELVGGNAIPGPPKPGEPVPPGYGQTSKEHREACQRALAQTLREVCAPMYDREGQLIDPAELPLLCLELEPGPAYLLHDLKAVENLLNEIGDAACRDRLRINLDIAHAMIIGLTPRPGIRGRKGEAVPIPPELLQRAAHIHLSDHAADHWMGGAHASDLTPASFHQREEYLPWLELAVELTNGVLRGKHLKSEDQKHQGFSGTVAIELEACNDVETALDAISITRRWLADARSRVEENLDLLAVLRLWWRQNPDHPASAVVRSIVRQEFATRPQVIALAVAMLTKGPLHALIPALQEARQQPAGEPATNEPPFPPSPATVIRRALTTIRFAGPLLLTLAPPDRRNRELEVLTILGAVLTVIRPQLKEHLGEFSGKLAADVMPHWLREDLRRLIDRSKLQLEPKDEKALGELHAITEAQWAALAELLQAPRRARLAKLERWIKRHLPLLHEASTQTPELREALERRMELWLACTARFSAGKLRAGEQVAAWLQQYLGVLVPRSESTYAAVVEAVLRTMQDEDWLALAALLVLPGQYRDLRNPGRGRVEPDKVCRRVNGKGVRSSAASFGAELAEGQEALVTVPPAGHPEFRKGVILTLDLGNSTHYFFPKGASHEAASISLQRHIELLCRTINDNSGSVMSFRGDGLIGFIDEREFNTKAQLARAALGICRRLCKQATSVPPPRARLRPLSVRVSLHYGEAYIPLGGPLRDQIIGTDVIVSTRACDRLEVLERRRKSKHQQWLGATPQFAALEATLVEAWEDRTVIERDQIYVTVQV